MSRESNSQRKGGFDYIVFASTQTIWISFNYLANYLDQRSCWARELPLLCHTIVSFSSSFSLLLSLLSSLSLLAWLANYLDQRGTRASAALSHHRLHQRDSTPALNMGFCYANSFSSAFSSQNKEAPLTVRQCAHSQSQFKIKQLFPNN